MTVRYDWGSLLWSPSFSAEKISLNNEETDKLEKVFAELEDNEDVSDYYTNLV